MKVAFLLRKFPVLSETFIIEQIVGLIECGVDIDIYAVFRGNSRDSHPLIHEYSLLKKAFFPKVICSHRILDRLRRAPKVFVASNSAPTQLQLKSLNVFKYRWQAALLHLLYLSSVFNGTQAYDIIHCHFGMYGLVGVDLRALGLVNGKIITSFHGMDVHIHPKRYGKSVYKRLFSLGDLFTVNSKFTRDCLLNLGCSSEKVVQLPVGLRSELYYRETDRSTNETSYILSVGRLTEKKGIEYAIRAVANLVVSFPGIQYNIVGDGPLRNRLQLLIEELGLNQHIHLLGSRNQVELRQMYAQSDIFILSSVTARNGDMEGQGLVLQEAQASGLPVISTWHNGIPEGVLVNQSGFLVPERDVDELTERLKFLLTHPDIRHRMGNTGQHYVRDNFDIRLLNQRLYNFYLELV